MVGYKWWRLVEVGVSVFEDLSGCSNIRIGEAEWPVQLLIGQPVLNDDDYKALMAVARRRV